MEETLKKLGFSLEKKLNVGENLNVFDKTIAYLSQILGYKCQVNYSDLQLRYSNHQDLYFVHDDFFDAILKREFEKISWKYKNERTQKPELLIKLTLLANIAETAYYYSNHKKQIKSKTISASDIASFSFCPASYCIHQSYEIKPSPLTEIGKKLHEETRLLSQIKTGQIHDKNKRDEHYFEDKEYKHFLNDIDNSQVIYCGHSENDKSRFFKNKELICQPDYIFQNRDGQYFVVEEKFRFVRKKKVETKHPDEIADQLRYESYFTLEDNYNDIFYANHRLQLAAYMYGIEDYKIEYGYLVYWHLKKDEVAKCIVTKVERSAALVENLRDTFRSIKLFNTNSSLLFDNGILNLNKCSNCSVAALCGHKSKRYSELKLPYYEGNYVRLGKTELPGDLAEYENEFKNFLSDNYQCQVCSNRVIGSEISPAFVGLDDYKDVYKFKVANTPNKDSKIISLHKQNPFSLNITWEKSDHFSSVDYLMRHKFYLGKICDSCRNKDYIPLNFTFKDDKYELFKKVKLTDFNKSEMLKNGITFKIDRVRKNIVLRCKYCNSEWEPFVEHSTSLLRDESPKCPKCDLQPLLIPLVNVFSEIQNNIELIFVEGGTFEMGNDERTPTKYDIHGRDMPDLHKHKVAVDSFYLARYPVTQKLWMAVMGVNMSDSKECYDCPVQNVSWNDASLFIERLNEITGEIYRLPTEAEWEFAARGGKNGDTGRYTQSFNDKEEKIKNVGTGVPNTLGIFDMSGNVQEWCADWFEYWNWNLGRSETLQNPRGPETGRCRVLKGGWCGGRTWYRATFRGSWFPDARSLNVGFRLAKNT